MKEVTVQDLKEKRDNKEDFVLIDVREHFEYEVSNLNGTHIPMGDIHSKLDELKEKKDEELIIMCRSGARSGNVTQFLEAQGFSNVSNLKGGITAWAREIEPGMEVA